MSYKDIATELIYENCGLCGKELENKISPWSICFDPLWEMNVWGADSYEEKAYICQECAEKLLKK